MRKIIALIIALIVINCGIAGVTALGDFVPDVDFYREIVAELDMVQVFDTSEYSADMLRNRDGKIMIEECIGVVTGTALDGSLCGKILNCGNPEYDYIGYRGIDAEIGDVILSYFIYNPDTEFEDDILYRFDYVIDGD